MCAQLQQVRFFLCRHFTTMSIISVPHIQDLNKLPNDELFKVLNTFFETAPPLAKALTQHIPFDSYLDR